MTASPLWDNLLNETDFSASALRLMQQCDSLAAISSMDSGINRNYLTPEHRHCHQQMKKWAQEAKLACDEDDAGNFWVSYPADNDAAPTLIIGSHLDTVPNAGKYDGILGVLTGLECLRQLQRHNISLPFNVDLVGFGDEEGTRFGTTLLGSRAVAGTWQDKWFTLRDSQNISLRKALQDFGCEPDNIGACSRAEDRLLAYLELHIEQGPVLEDQGLPLGIVTGIAGARRFLITFSGQAGHAGTVPMNMRQDALVAAADAIMMIERIAREYRIVATVGQIHCSPGAPNVIPGTCKISLDIRSIDDEVRDEALDAISHLITASLRDRNMSADWQEIHNAGAVACADWLQETLATVLTDMQLLPYRLASGAGHDAMSMATVTPVGMLFMRCEKGISHNPAEAVSHDDVALATEALLRTLRRLAENHSLTHT